MLVYCLKRIGLAVLTIFCIIAITFFSMNAIPGGPFDAEKAPSEEVKAVLMERYNLEKPLFEQFVIYVKNHKSENCFVLYQLDKANGRGRSRIRNQYTEIMQGMRYELR